ncbi:hypothetical protein [Rubrobacter aplysinae]|uniref:hypothetical protein n=1 Tax=Rubrobacter aplysinae TaxID=909625 RepID=UPI00064BDB36|nr:hypothetical protein [Rubrobacter aplysinae]
MTRIGGIPEDFEAAYGGLVEIVESIGSGEVSEELVPEKADEYRRVNCRGSAALAGSALRALSYELSSRGLQEGATSYPQELQAVALVEAVLEPALVTHAAGNETSEIVEVALPEQLREITPNGRGFVMGELQMTFEPCHFARGAGRLISPEFHFLEERVASPDPTVCGEGRSIMCLYQPLPHLMAPNTGNNGHPTSREEAEFRRTRPVLTLSSGRGRKKLSRKLLALHSGSSGLEVAGTDPLAVYYLPRAFQGLEGEP